MSFARPIFDLLVSISALAPKGLKQPLANPESHGPTDGLNQRPSSEGIETHARAREMRQCFSCLNQRPSSEGIETGPAPLPRPLRGPTGLNQRPSSEGIETPGRAAPSRRHPRAGLNQRPSSEGIETLAVGGPGRNDDYHVSISALAPKGLKRP